jgi:hypothetical protein
MDKRTSGMTDSRRGFLSTLATGLFGVSAAVKIGRGDSAVSAWTGADTNSLLNQARPKEKGQLKIVKVEPMIMRFRRSEQGSLGGNYCLMCRIETDEGVVGWGEGTNFPKVATIATEIEMVKPLVLGKSAWDIERRIPSTAAGTRLRQQRAVRDFAIDIALWDIVGQLDVPLYRLLGAR